MKKNEIRTVLFDLDGTIIDTNELIIVSFLEALRGTVPDGFGREQIIPHMGKTLTSQMQQFAGREDVADLVQAYREVNYRLHDEYVLLFSQVDEVMKKLKEHGYKIGIVTTKMRQSTERSLRFTGIADYCDVIVTLDDVEYAKPHPEPVEKAMRALGAAPGTALMVGDSTMDIESALAAGAVAAGVAWSLKGEELLRQAGAQHILHHIHDIYTIVGLE